MRIYTKIVYDDAAYRAGRYVVDEQNSEWFDHDGPVAECKPGKSSNQQNAEAQTTADQQKQGQLTDAAQGTLSQYEGPVQNSPFYNALLTTGTEATSDAYNNAASNVRARANQAGFGYNQPVENGAEAGVRTAQAKTQAQLPGQAMMQAGQMGLQAANQTGQMGMGYGNQGLGYANLAGQMDARRKSFWDTLAQTGGQAAGMAAMAAGA